MVLAGTSNPIHHFDELRSLDFDKIDRNYQLDILLLALNLDCPLFNRWIWPSANVSSCPIHLDSSQELVTPS